MLVKIIGFEIGFIIPPLVALYLLLTYQRLLIHRLPGFSPHYSSNWWWFPTLRILLVLSFTFVLTFLFAFFRKQVWGAGESEVSSVCYGLLLGTLIFIGSTILITPPRYERYNPYPLYESDREVSLTNPTLDFPPTKEHRGRLQPFTLVPNRAVILRWLKQKRYRKLETEIKRVLRLYENDEVSDRGVDYVFSGFKSTSFWVGQRLDEWVSLNPSSALPYVARGYHLWSSAYEARGIKLSKNTRSEQFTRMAMITEQAVEDFLYALQIRPNLPVIYSQLIGIDTASGSPRLNVFHLIRRGLKADPGSYVIRNRILWGLQPKWGGSLRQMKIFIDQTLEHADENPELKVLSGWLPFAKAERIGMSDKPDKKKKYYDRALQYGKKPWFLKERADLLNRDPSYDSALQDLNHALRIYPKKPSYLEEKGHVHWNLGDTTQALKIFTEAKKLDGMNHSILWNRALLLWIHERYQESARDIEKATVYEPYDVDYWWRLGSLHMWKLGNYEKASHAYKRAIDLKPNRPDFHYNYVNALLKQDSCKTPAALKKYFEICEEKQCEREHIEWARGFRNYLKKRDLWNKKNLCD